MSRDTGQVVSAVKPQRGLTELQEIMHASSSGHDFPGGSDGKAPVYSAGDRASIPGVGRSLGERNGNPPQDYCLENPMDREAW